ncbi:MAG TPA: sugar phosphate isomerase/epimerase family protein [Myxococcota bacterium]|nr:sugar phosphate isomerase/epimerase family protein [Myxococcota bacterium]
MTDLGGALGRVTLTASASADDAAPLKDASRLSFNQATAERASLPDVIEACARAGVPGISLWRHKLAETGVERAAKLLRDAGLWVSSVCRGGMFPALTASERAARIEDNRRAIDDAATLGAEVLVLVCGAAPDRAIGAARAMVADGIAAIAPYAAERGVRLGIEPLHPAFAAERSCITTMREARLISEQYDASNVGVVVDVYHVWWDPERAEEIARLGDRIAGYHVNDWLVPVKNVLMNRGMMGDGVIELRRIRGEIERAGYMGPIEVEIFNESIWERPLDELVRLTKERFVEVS